MLTDQILHGFLWDQARGEAIGLGRFVYLRRSTRLGVEDRQLLERRLVDEVNHGAWLTARARHYGPRPVQGGPVWDTCERDYHGQVAGAISPEEMLVYAYLPERFATRVLQRAAGDVRVHGDRETADLLDQLVLDEQRHVRENGALLQRWVADPEIGPGIRAAWHAALRGNYHKSLFSAPLPVGQLPAQP
jgi:hypothetical protein